MVNYLILLLASFCLAIDFDTDTQNFKEVYVESYYLDLPGIVKITRSYTELRLVAYSAETVADDVRLFCKMKNRKVIYSNIEVSPFYRNTSDGLQCFTKMPMDKSYGAKAEASTEYELRPSSNLVNGINPLQHKYCAETGGFKNPWFMLDLRDSIDVKEIIISTHPHGYYTALPDRMDVKYTDNVREDGLKLLEEYRGSDDDSGKQIKFSVNKPIRMRYLIFEKFKSSNYTNFMLCNVQIF